MANNFNPVTGRKVSENSALEIQGGYVYFDDEDGLCWGDGALPAGVSADKLFTQLYGKDRPDTYKQYLAKLNAPPADGLVDGVEAGTAADVLDDSTESQVLITGTKVIDYAALAGFAGSVGHGAIEADGHREVAQGRIDGGVHVSALGQGASKPAAPSGQPDTEETVAARADADAFGRTGAVKQSAADKTSAADKAKQAKDEKAAADAAEAQALADQQAADEALAAEQQAETDRLAAEAQASGTGV